MSKAFTIWAWSLIAAGVAMTAYVVFACRLWSEAPVFLSFWVFAPYLMLAYYARTSVAAEAPAPMFVSLVVVLLVGLRAYSGVGILSPTSSLMPFFLGPFIQSLAVAVAWMLARTDLVRNAHVLVPQRRHDFEADVRFLSHTEGGLLRPVVQGYRPDLRYVDDEPDEVWMIWPRFLAEDGSELPRETAIPREARANFYILNDELRRTVHQMRLDEGVRFELRESGKKIAVGRVTKIVGLFDDSDERS